MASSISHFMNTATLFLLALSLSLTIHQVMSTVNINPTRTCGPLILATDTDRVRFALNLEYLEAEFYLVGALGRGLDSTNPDYSNGGPPPIGGQKARLDDPDVARIIEEFAYQEVGHIRAITSAVGGIPRPLLDISSATFAKAFNKIVGYSLKPPFNPYANSVNFLLATYAIPYLGLNGYVGTLPSLITSSSRELIAKLLGVEGGQDAVVRSLLYKKANQKVVPYNITVAKFTNLISASRNLLGGCGNKDEGIILPNTMLGAENKTTSNVLSADANSLAYPRTPAEILRVLYGSGDESVPGGLFPKGANGAIARRYLTR
ncbi:desiccation-related protein PCC13-62-like [Argentina anserina]|uniref:desiccation-related protein PCC13-62-like n=1 Tax=Argentina anserina TaxID=57926 RepID=UPI0021768F78|nr:desiccation-related protein PCC13-62-like [Potentilla anserina]